MKTFRITAAVIVVASLALVGLTFYIAWSYGEAVTILRSRR